MDSTQILAAHVDGDERAANQLLPLVYEELHRLAATQLEREPPGHTLQPTALVHEAYLRLIDQDRTDWKGRTHFFALAAISMRRVLVDHARAKTARKRGGGVRRTTLTESKAGQWEDQEELLAVHEALEALAQVHGRQARVVELRFFGGLGQEETAAVLGIHVDTVKADWRFARAWLNRKLSVAGD